MEKMLNILQYLLKVFFQHQLQIKMYHFQTKKYGAHKACDKYLKKFRSNLDRFMEVAQGAFSKFKIESIEINFETVDDVSINSELDKFVKLCRSLDHNFKDYSELINIRDEIIADVEQFKYLLTFD
jgi:hypothetical protein